MRIAYFDCTSGICGSMIVGAFLDAGLDIESLQKGLAALGLPELSISVRKVRRQSLSGSLFRVHEGESDAPVDGIQVRAMPRVRRSILRDMPRPKHAHRNLHDIETILRTSNLGTVIVDEAMRIFDRLAQAEASVHGTSVSEVHFHEVGALDAISDIVCAVLARRILGIERIVSSPVAVGNGKVRCQHGSLPVPAPATIRLLLGVPLRSHPAQTELTTPTGAAILAEWADTFGDLPDMTVDRIGYGAGEKELDHANLLRVLIGETGSETDRTWELDSVIQIETHLDDMSPEDLPVSIQRILDAGALDAAISPLFMKKGRSGHFLSALCRQDKLASVANSIFNHTTSIGFRHFPVSRTKLRRQEDAVETGYGRVTGKRVERPGGIFTFKPDFEVCHKLSTENEVSVGSVRHAAAIAWSNRRWNP